MAEVLEKQRENIVQKQITVQREFKGQAFMSKPEEVLFSDYIVGETYSQVNAAKLLSRDRIAPSQSYYYIALLMIFRVSFEKLTQ